MTTATILNRDADRLERDTYRGWSIQYDPPPIPWRGADWRATGPNYDAWTEGEGEWADSGEKAEAPTREALIAEIDAWFDEQSEVVSALREAAKMAGGA